jgi:LacI family transcriptional regulator
MVRRIHLSIDLGSGHSRGIVRGVVEAMQAHDLQWVLTSDWTEINEQENRGGSADGVIGLLSDPANLERWRRRKIPMVNVSSARATDGIVSVFSDNVAIGCVAAEFFLAKGFTRFAYVQSGPSRYAAERRAGFCQRVAPVGTVEVCEIGGGSQLRRFLSGLRPPCAIFTASDSVARHVLNTLADLRRSVPEEFSVLGVDNDEVQGMFSPVQLSSVAQLSVQIGRHAALALNEIFRGGKSPVLTLVPPGPVIERQSTDLVAIPDPLVAGLVRRIREQACAGVRASDVILPSDGSRRGLEMKFRRWLGRSIEEEIRRNRLGVARSKVLLSDLSMAEIAEQCGFANVFHFTRSFSRHFGISPGRMRRQSKT